VVAAHCAFQSNGAGKPQITSKSIEKCIPDAKNVDNVEVVCRLSALAYYIHPCREYQWTPD
jgi:hypothetical protein